MDTKHIESANASSAKTSDLTREKELSASTSTANNVSLYQEPLKPTAPTNADGFASLARLRKNILYAVVTVAIATDTLGTSCLFVSTEEIARDIGLAEGGNAIWIISAYAMAFAACIPLGGRLCDVLPAQWSYLGGFIGMAGLTLGNSFGESYVPASQYFVCSPDRVSDSP
jgi:hypothetical protein